ncbi:holin [Mycobacterium phage prophi91-3]|uniref:holin n=1 Tax=Mycobacteroides abscessus TaxID=36809 RepID=UPI0019D2016F|nr:holin [Mycobacteroides abscessus]QSM88812.1 hypothetical protein I3U44_24260 [Mycobacteroides abscessus subsp. bolletii]QST90066.1 holin [Mycobacterium phage prophi91-3]
MTITISPDLKDASVDAGERAVKTFAGGFIVGAGLIDAALNTVVGNVTVAASQINWAHGLDVGAGTTVVSLLFSLASIKLGNPGTASLTKAVIGVFKARQPAAQSASVDYQFGTDTSGVTAAAEAVQAQNLRLRAQSQITPPGGIQ